jgi:hypothetical protein
MAKPNLLHELPVPHSTVSGRNNQDKGNQKFSTIARLWRPRNTPFSEPAVSTLARFAGYLIDRETGKAYSADKLMGVSSAEDILNMIGNGSVIDLERLPFASSLTAFVAAAASGVPEIGDSSAPFPSIRAALNALPTGATAPRNIVLINTSIGESFPFAPLAGDPPFTVTALNRASRFLWSDLYSSPASALITLENAGGDVILRLSSDGTVGLDVPSLSAFSTFYVTFDLERLASLTIAGNGMAANDGPASLGVTARNCGFILIDIIGVVNGANHSNGGCFMTLVNCGSNDSSVSINSDYGWGYFSDLWVTVIGGLYTLLNHSASSGGITAGGVGYSHTLSSTLSSDMGGNFDHTFW